MSYPFALLMNPPDPTYPEYPALLAAAKRTVPRFVDPACPYVSKEARGRRGTNWCTAVLGFPYEGRLTSVEDQLLLLADQADINPALPDWIVEAHAEGERMQAERDRRRREQAEREAANWREVLEMARVRLEVREGSRGRVRGSVYEPLRHAVPLADGYSGKKRIRTHRAGHALCEGEKRARPLDLGGAVDLPATCVRCLQWALQVRPDTGGAIPGITPQQRAAMLVDEVDRLGRVLGYAAATPIDESTVHVIGPDEDQPLFASAVESLMYRRFRAVCGWTIQLQAPDGQVGVFEDVRLCHACREAFGDRAPLIFEHNTWDYQGDGALANQGIRISKELAADRAAAGRG